MRRQKKAKQHRVWIFVLLLAVCVAASTLVVTDRLHAYLMDDSGAIELRTVTSPAASEDNDGPGSGNTPNDDKNSDSTKKNNTSAQNSAFEVSDDDGIWSKETEVDIFCFSYKNGKGEVTVNSEDTDKVIAPGTENSYTFKLKNSGDTALDYDLEIEAYFSPEGTTIPVTARLSRYDGKWLVGNGNEFVKALLLDGTKDSATLGAGKYTYYTLDWQWMFDGNDAVDTALGNTAATEDLTFTIKIKTVAEISDDPANNSGIKAPQTGDITGIAMLISIAVGAFVLMILLLILYLRDRKEEEEEEGAH
ncbi:MAG: hypothetical protein IKV45_04335 [Firmicutes bacterium]|nr:hypothetical protein [Bacillota bacterium]